MDRRNLIKNAGIFSLATLVNCDSGISGYEKDSDEAGMIEEVKSIIEESKRKKREPAYTSHEIKDKKEKHSLKFGDNYIAEIHPPGTSLDDFGFIRAKGRLGVVYLKAVDDCETLREYYKEIKTMEEFPKQYLIRALFIEHEVTERLNLYGIKSISKGSLSSKGRSYFDKLR